MRLAAAIALAAHAKDTPVDSRQLIRHGLPITVEHKKGSLRILHDDKGKVVYKQNMHADYGYFNHTKGRDGDEVDCFVGPLKNAGFVYVAHMKDMGPVKSEREDEDKCFIGYPGADAAKTAFLLHYPATFFGGMTTLSVADFKAKLKQAQKPYREKKIHGVALACPKCGSKKISLMPTDFETAKCKDCGKTWDTNEMKTQGMATPRVSAPAVGRVVIK